MRTNRPRWQLIRITGVIGAIIAIVSGITFAALQSQAAILQGSTITSATASLSIGDTQGNYAATASGFNFANIVPGGPAAPSPGNILKLRNNGTTNLALKIAINPTILQNPGNANLGHIYLDMTPVGGGETKQLSLEAILNGYGVNNPLALDMAIPAGQTAQYNLQIEMSADVTANSQVGVAISNLDLIFSGVAT